jgi:hypothetical protein
MALLYVKGQKPVATKAPAKRKDAVNGDAARATAE